MGYYIEYQRTERKRRDPFRCIRLPVLIAFCFSFFLLLVTHKWPEGIALIQKVKLFPAATIAMSALNNFADELQFGTPLVAAFAGFCNNLVS